VFLETFIPYLAAAVPAFLLGLYIGRNSSTKVISKPAHNAISILRQGIGTILTCDVPYDQLDAALKLVETQATSTYNSRFIKCGVVEV